MKKKTFVAAAIMLMLLGSGLVCSLFLEQASANPVGLYMPQSPPPAPTIEVIGLDADKLTLTFSVQKAGPWITPIGSEYWGNYEPHHEWNYSVSSIVWVDGNPWSHFSEQNPITVSLEDFGNGSHTLIITATAHGDKYWPTSSVYSDVIKFQVNNPSPAQTGISTATTTPNPSNSPSPSPTPSPKLEPSLEPAQTATPTNDDNQTLDLAPIILAAVIVVAVAVGALVYLRRRKP